MIIVKNFNTFGLLIKIVKYLSYAVSIFLLGFMILVDSIFLFKQSPYRTVILIIKSFSLTLVGVLVYNKFWFLACFIDLVSDLFVWFFVYLKVAIFFIKRLIFLQHSIGQLSHDVQNHLTVINLSAQIISEDEEKTQHSKYLYLIEKNINNIVTLIGNFQNQIMLQFPRFQYHDIVSLIENFVKQRKTIMPDNIYTVIYDSNVINVYCDKNYLTSIIYNIIKNAEESPVAQKHKKQIKIVIIDAGSYVKIMFIDNGQGFHGKNADDVFQNNYTTKSYGSGLGMGIIKDLVELHNGKVSILPDLDHGRVVVKLKK